MLERAEPLKLNFEEQAYLHSINWLEQYYDDKVWVLDIDFKLGNLSLYGEAHDTANFRQDMNNMMVPILEKVPPWREV